ncbi:MAG TPA: HAD hydrolase-like protein [Bacteroidales bacterium]|nr:HAD hydrolase-like protein [Bacteroidales bacterium]HPT21357.1 HAD hydrolase-like protein [Bacteroidales bacterium]
MDYQKELKELKPEHEYFIGIDSDGCIFDSMEVKQKEFFIPNALKFFDLYAISETLRETWEFVNLYSMHRGGNRFISMIKVFDLLNRRGEVKNSGCLIPDMTSLKAWVKVETKLGNDSLREYFRSHYDQDLERVLRWSEAVNDDIARYLHNIPSFPHAIDALKKITSYADLVIVSQTPLEALNREWEEHDLKKYVKIIAGQEHGTKAEHINLSAKGKYHDNKILMIGDAKGDLDAARKNGILFYPIIPGEEDKSWERFLNEGIQKFTGGTYSGIYEEKLLEEFNKSLPGTPPWQ